MRGFPFFVFTGLFMGMFKTLGEKNKNVCSSFLET